MNKLKINLVQYLRDTIGVEVDLRDWEKWRGFPQYLRARYHYFMMTMLGTECVLVVDTDEKEQTPAIINKQFDQIRSLQNATLIYVREAVSSFNRKRLIEHKVPFIIPGNQMYLPMLGIDLREHIRQIRESKPKLSPSTQALILSILWKMETGTITPTEVATRLGYSLMTMTRAFNELELAGIGKHTTMGKSRQLKIVEQGNELLNLAMPFLGSPIRKQCYVASKDMITCEIYLAGESALAKYSMLTESTIPVYALSLEDWKQEKVQKQVMELTYPEQDCCGIEIWKYAPALFAQNGVVDRVSLYLSLMDNHDARVQIAQDQMIGEITW